MAARGALLRAVGQRIIDLPCVSFRQTVEHYGILVSSTWPHNVAEPREQIHLNRSHVSPSIQQQYRAYRPSAPSLRSRHHSRQHDHGKPQKTSTMKKNPKIKKVVVIPHSVTGQSTAKKRRRVVRRNREKQRKEKQQAPGELVLPPVNGGDPSSMIHDGFDRTFRKGGKIAETGQGPLRDDIPPEVKAAMEADPTYFLGRDGMASFWTEPSVPPSQHPAVQSVMQEIIEKREICEGSPSSSEA